MVKQIDTMQYTAFRGALAQGKGVKLRAKCSPGKNPATWQRRCQPKVHLAEQSRHSRGIKIHSRGIKFVPHKHISIFWPILISSYSE